jgi:hypothetical protein
MKNFNEKLFSMKKILLEIYMYVNINYENQIKRILVFEIF